MAEAVVRWPKELLRMRRRLWSLICKRLARSFIPTGCQTALLQALLQARTGCRAAGGPRTATSPASPTPPPARRTGSRGPAPASRAAVVCDKGGNATAALQDRIAAAVSTVLSDACTAAAAGVPLELQHRP